MELGPEDVSLLEKCPHFRGYCVQASMELEPEDVSLLERCPHFGGCYVQASMELGPKDMSLLERCPHFSSVSIPVNREQSFLEEHREPPAYAHFLVAALSRNDELLLQRETPVVVRKHPRGSWKVELHVPPCPQSHNVFAHGVWPGRRTVCRWQQTPRRVGCYETGKISQFGPAQTMNRSTHTHTPTSSPACEQDKPL